VRWRLLKNSGYVFAAGMLIAAGGFVPALAITTVQSRVCEDFAAPAIVSPGDGLQTKDASIMVEGTGEPGKSVMVLRNGDNQGVGAIASDGTFGFTVPLEQGDNVLVAREANECGTTKDSSSVTVHADLPAPPNPEPPVSEPLQPGGTAGPTASVPSTGNIGRPFVPKPSGSGLEKPKISSSNDDLTVYVDTLLIEGTAHPGSLLTVYVNGKSQAQLYASKNGTFRLRVVLSEGKNTLKVRSTLGSKTADSDEVTVTYIKRITATLTRPLSSGQIIATAFTSGAAVVGSAVVALGADALIHRYRTKWRRK
jgi:hypothetical protein